MAFSLSHPNPPIPTNPNEVHIYPVVPLREGVVFPHTEPTLTFGRPKSSSAIDAAFRGDKHIVFVAQKQPITDPTPADLYHIGTLCVIEQILPMGNDLLALVRGIKRVKINTIVTTDPFLSASVEVLDIPSTDSDKTVALARQVLNEFKKSFNLGKSVDFPVFMRLMAGVSATELADQIANILDINTSARQDILETLSTDTRLEKVHQLLAHEVKVIELERSIATKTHAKFDKQMREQVLRERKRTIQSELEKMGADAEEDDDLGDLKKKLKAAAMPIHVHKKADKELARLSQMSFNNPEANYIRNYLDWLGDMPWAKHSKTNMSLDRAASILDEDHYGLKKIKERIIENLAVMKLKSKNGTTSETSPTILCFVGPPGVGKTSIGKSIARALGRKFVRISLGGIRDEAEIRGHRRTYVGAMPGRIIQGIKNAGTGNPVFMLDEIDKLGADYRGDPSAALLETLDPEQNKEFSDHYLEVPYDLSQVMFVTTANMLETIPPALRDRLEIISFPGYTLEEKFNIAKNYLWPKQLSQNGLPKGVKVEDMALKEIIKRYTLEAGVRSLERQIAKVCRKLARISADSKKPIAQVKLADIRKFLGPERVPETLAEKQDEVGMTTGLSWSEVGGGILFIEVALMPGKGELVLTGQLGDVMKESARAAFSYVRSRWQKLGLAPDFYKKLDVHIHVPEGATPKDGPSAGLAIATALVSALTSQPVRRDTAMTGEITLRGRALEIGGVKEKVIAAHRAGIKHIIMPRDNRKDLEEIPSSVKRELKFFFVSHLDDVLKLAFRSLSKSKKTQPKVSKRTSIGNFATLQI